MLLTAPPACSARVSACGEDALERLWERCARARAQNSWSTYWGDKGYVKVARAHGCGVTTSAMYAIMERHSRGVNASAAAAPAAAMPASA